MSYREAIEDGIVIIKNAKGFTTYFIPCHICGASVPNWGYNRELKYTCDACRNKLIAEKRELRLENNKEEKLKKAIKRISKIISITKYDEAINEIKEELFTNGWYQSTEEIMVGLELKRRKIPYMHQHKIEGYKVDFVIPTFKVALEVDGIFHTNEKKDEEILRDLTIKSNLGIEWEVIHIKTEYINMNITKIITAIKELKKYRSRHF